MPDDLVWPDWRDDGSRSLSLTGLVAQALGTVRSDPLIYMVLHKYPELLRDARLLVLACTQGAEAQVIIDAADRYLRTLLSVARASRSSGADQKATDRAIDRFPQAERTRQATQEQLRLKKQLASAQPVLF